MTYYGFDEVVYGWQRYFDLCNSFELRNPTDPADTPNLETLNRWRVDSPRGFAWIIHPDPAIVDLLVDAYERNDRTLPEGIDAAIDKTEARAHALAAKAILLETPPGLPPSDVSRELIRRLGERWLARSKRALLWESSGLWTFEDGGTVARDAGFVYVVDPFMLESEEIALPRASTAAFRVTERAAARREFDGWEMEKLLEWAAQTERTFILLAGRFKISHAKELSLQLKQQAPPVG